MEDNDSYTFAVLFSVSFARSILQDIMPGKRKEVGGRNGGESKKKIKTIS